MNAANNQPQPPDVVSRVLVVVFLVGIYLGVAAHFLGTVPVPNVIAGVAGTLLLFTQSPHMRERHLATIIIVLILYTLSILMASDSHWLIERFKGLVQLIYSIFICYALFLAVTRYPRRSLATIFLTLSLVILIGCTLETYTPFKHLSDTFRGWAFSSGVYAADLRDQLLYGRIRPKFFTSEPSFVAFMFALFSFCWYVLSQARLKLLGYLVLVAIAYFLIRGPSLFLGVALIPVYEVLLRSRRGPTGEVHIDFTRAAWVVTLSAVFAGALIPLIHALYADRIGLILAGEDPSFFSRVIAPPLVAFKVVAAHPVAGAGLTSWEFISNTVREVYATAPWFSSNFRFLGAANSITNYFWLHWIFLGLFWGVILMGALTVLLRSLSVPSVLFCWIVWSVFGQGAGSYVGPRAWAVLFLAAAISVVCERSRVRERRSFARYLTINGGFLSVIDASSELGSLAPQLWGNAPP